MCHLHRQKCCRCRRHNSDQTKVHLYIKWNRYYRKKIRRKLCPCNPSCIRICTVHYAHTLKVISLVDVDGTLPEVMHTILVYLFSACDAQKKSKSDALPIYNFYTKKFPCVLPSIELLKPYHKLNILTIFI